jgi:hypothetical protein
LRIYSTPQRVTWTTLQAPDAAHSEAAASSASGVTTDGPAAALLIGFPTVQGNL